MIAKSRKNSLIGYFSKDNLFYAVNYEQAYLTLYESDKYIDQIIHPMMFCLRHYLELMMKECIIKLFKYSEANNLISQLDSTHALDKIFEAFNTHYSKAKTKIFNDYEDQKHLKKLNELACIFINLDNQSYSFRYAKQKKNRQTQEAPLNFQQEQQINAEKIHSNYLGASQFLWAISSTIEELECQ